MSSNYIFFLGKPTHRFVRETSDEEEGRANKIKEFFSQFYGGSAPQGSSPANNPDSSTSNQQSSSEYQPELLTSSIAETPAGPEAKD